MACRQERQAVVTNFLRSIATFAWTMFFLFAVLAMIDKISLTFSKGVLIGLFFFIGVFFTLAWMGREPAKKE